MNYQACKYYDQDLNREVWAVYCKKSSTYYFAKQKGEQGAINLANRLNREV